MKRGIKNIIFDLGGILVGLNKQRSVQAFQQIGAANVAKYVEEHLTADLFLEIETGKMDTAEFCNEVRSMAQCSAKDEEIIWAWNQLLTGIPNKKKQQLIQLKQRHRLFLLSNTNKMHWQKCTKDFFPYLEYTANSYFEKVYLSYEMHLSKPHSNIFTSVLETSKLLPAETLFIDDSLENCQSAANLGIEVLHDATGNNWLKYTE